MHECLDPLSRKWKQARGTQEEWNKFATLLTQQVTKRHHQSESSHVKMLLWWAAATSRSGGRTESPESQNNIFFLYLDIWYFILNFFLTKYKIKRNSNKLSTFCHLTTDSDIFCWDFLWQTKTKGWLWSTWKLIL